MNKMLKQKILVIVIGVLIIAGTLIITSQVTPNRENSETEISTFSEPSYTPSEEADTTGIEDTTAFSSEEITESQTETPAFEPIMTENGGEIEVIIPDDQDGEGF